MAVPDRPVLYSFRRCPYAIRARLALAAAGLRPGRDLELREVSLRAKPPELLEVSPKGTVPVLVDGPVVMEESLQVMHWALERNDRLGWRRGWSPSETAMVEALIAENDGPFKHHLDRFKYASRFRGVDGEAPEQHRQAAWAVLRRWSRRLESGGWLLGRRPSLADWALLPFVRQFRQADPEGWDAASDLDPLHAWLARFCSSAELAAVLEPPWAERSRWRSPRWLYHLALREDWQEARAAGVYRRSTRGRSLEQVGFIHLSTAEQVPGTACRFFADCLPSAEAEAAAITPALLLLTIDPQRLERAGLPLRVEAADPAAGGTAAGGTAAGGTAAGGTAERFPHLYGPLPLEAVLLAEPYRP